MALHTECVHKTIPSPVLNCDVLTLKQIGFCHGLLLHQQILRQLSIYRHLFRSSCGFEWEKVLDVAEEFRETIGRLAPDLLEEMSGIVNGVREDLKSTTLLEQSDVTVINTLNDKDEEAKWDRDVGLLDIVALNARSEIALGRWDDGCTSVAWNMHTLGSAKQFLAQNWDWRTAVGANLALLSISQERKPDIWMVAEPGIIGKIGYNSYSVGVCLNAIRASLVSTPFFPIHVLFRMILECISVSSAIALVEKLSGSASAQHILVADPHESKGLELSPHDQVYLSADENDVFVHTNHFLENKSVDEPPWLEGSPLRLMRARELVGEIDREVRGGLDVNARLLRERIFSDTVGSPQAICCTPDVGGHNGSLARVQTLFNIVMVFEENHRPHAEIVFGQPGSEQGSEVYTQW